MDAHDSLQLGSPAVTDEDPAPREVDDRGPEEATRRRALRDLRGDLVRYLPSQVLPALIAFFTIPVLTRLLPPAEFGDYRLVLAAISVFGAAGSWLATSIYRFYPEMEMSERVDEFRATVQGLLAATAGVAAVLWLAGLPLSTTVIGMSSRYVYLLGGILMVVTIAWGVANAQVRAVREVGWYNLSVVLNKALTLGIGVGLILLTPLRVDGLLYGSIAGSVLLFPILLGVIRRQLPRAGARSRALGRQMLRYGIPIALVQVANWTLQLSDRFIIAALRDLDEVGLYGAAYGIAEQGMETILVMFELPFTVLASRVWERDGREAASVFVSDSVRSHLLVAVPAWAGISILSRQISAVMTAEPYHEAWVVMPIVSLALLISGIQWWYSVGSTFLKKTGQLVISILAAVVVNVTLNLLLVGRFGYVVAAYTTLAAYFVAMVVMILLTRRDFVWKFPFLAVGRALLASTLMAAVIWLIISAAGLGPTLTLAVSIPAGVAVYGLALAGIGEPAARKLLTQLGRRVRPGN